MGRYAAAAHSESWLEKPIGGCWNNPEGTSEGGNARSAESGASRGQADAPSGAPVGSARPGARQPVLFLCQEQTDGIVATEEGRPVDDWQRTSGTHASLRRWRVRRRHGSIGIFTDDDAIYLLGGILSQLFYRTVRQLDCRREKNKFHLRGFSTMPLNEKIVVISPDKEENAL